MIKTTLPPILLAFLVGCGSTTPPPNSAMNAPAEPVDAGVSMLTNDPGPPPEPPAPPPAPEPVRITAGERRATPTPSPRVAITAPRNGVTVREDRVEVRLAIQNWRDVNNADDHRHIHLVLDDEPYRRIDDPRQPVVLEHLSPGTHVLRAFPGWETHETVKDAGAFAMTVFHVGRAAQNFTFNPRTPLLTYSRPKGEVNGAEADRILLDFYLANVPAAEMGAQGFRVRPTIDGHAMDDLPAWVPYYIENLPDGPHTIGLQLIGRDGAPAAGLFNTTEHRITVNHGAAATPHAHPAPAAGASLPGADAGAAAINRPRTGPTLRDPAVPPAASPTSPPSIMPSHQH
ncbi:MAG: hypothetical protein Q8S73_09435 [Deltaproteobacteria bacterium]|nr:hypothetical protein [Myxococcales bacterium]MDP3214314.1 hypothetical protein [Deltaproteobacteria bacterium]